jgi:hypothetical protein
MFRTNILAAAVAAAIAIPAFAFAADDAEIEKIREEIKDLKDGYENRIRSLEDRLREAESTGTGAGGAPAASASTPAYANKPITTQNAFNPAISLILDGKYQNLERDPGTYQIGGFIPAGGHDDAGGHSHGSGPGEKGFSINESELTISANIDPYFAGYFTAGISADNELEVEEAHITNSGFIPGTTIKFGRFFSGIAYLNEQHPHAWDFADAPLVYQAFLGGNLGEDGLQARWVAPTPLFLEFGLEAGRGASFPGSEREKNGFNAGAAFVHIGGDAGVSNSYRVGASYRKTTAVDRHYEDESAVAGGEIENAFNGDSKMWGVDFIWKWAPNGDPTSRNFKFQAEYFQRKEDGTLTFDPEDTLLLGAPSDAYSSDQNGWYAQAVYQFMPRWRVGARYDQLDSGTVDNALVGGAAGLTANDFPILAAYDPMRTTAMIDFSPSEFSRFRLQFARDEARFSESDDQVFLQYTMSLGAHGAHKF